MLCHRLVVYFGILPEKFIVEDDFTMIIGGLIVRAFRPRRDVAENFSRFGLQLSTSIIEPMHCIETRPDGLTVDSDTLIAEDHRIINSEPACVGSMYAAPIEIPVRSVLWIAQCAVAI